MTQTMEIALVSAGSALLGGVLGGVLSGAYQHWRDWYSRPQLQIDYEETDANKVVVDYTKSDGTHIAEIYVRVRVRNTGRRTAKGAQVFWTSLKELNQSLEVRPAKLFHDSMSLAWAGWSFEPRDIPPAGGVSFYVDLLKVSKHYSGWSFSANLLASQDDLKKYKGTYRFQLTITADNAKPATCEVDVDYRGDWNNLRAVAAPKV